MKVLMLLSYPGLTGPAELALSDAVALRDMGHQVLFGCDTRRGFSPEERRRRLEKGEPLFLGDPLKCADQDFGAYIEKAGFQVMQELTLCKSAPWPHEMLGDVVRLRRRMKDADVVHTRFSHELLLAVAAARTLGKPPAIVHSVEQPPHRRPGMAMRAAGLLVFPSDFARRRFIEASHGDIAEARTRILPGRVDAEGTFTPGDGGKLRSELGILPEELAMGIVARIKVERRHELLVRAFARIAGEIPQAKLCVVGRGKHLPALKELASSLGLGDRVVWAGYRTGQDLVEAYRALDVKVWLVQGNDGTSRAALEAMACGTPVIAGKGGAQAELVRHGQDGFVVPLDLGWKPGMPDGEGEIAALAQAMKDCADGDRRKAMSLSARQRALEFTPSKRGERLLKIYQEALDGRRR